MFVVPEKTANQALLNAAASADIELFEMALACGANIHSLQQRENFGPLEVGHLAMAGVLRSAEKSADIRNHKWIIQNLISQGLDLNKQHFPAPSSFALHSAVVSKHSELVQLLLDNGATLWTTGQAGADLPRWAASVGMGWLVARILRELSENDSAIDPDMRRGLEVALGRAAYEGHIEIVRLLLDFGVEIESPNDYGDSTPLMQAATMGHMDVIELLRQRGANILAVGQRGTTVLFCAVRGGLFDFAWELLEKGADPLANDLSQTSVLYEAAGDEAFADELIRRGASLLRPNFGSDKVLHAAARTGNLKLAQACLKAGEKADAENDWGYTPLMYAARNGQVPMMEYLAQNGANPDHVAHYLGETPLYYAIEGHQLDAITWLTRKKVTLSHTIETIHLGDVSPLGLAACLGQPDTIRLLLDAGADIHFRTPEKWGFGAEPLAIRK